MQNPDFSIVFPVMNQADHIEKVIKSYHQALSKEKFSFELIAVVNCSKDKSYEICEKVSRKLSGVRSYELSGCGFGLGILHGLKKAKGKHLCWASSARTYPDELVMCLKQFLAHPEVIISGARKKRDKFLRSLGALIYDATIKLVFNIASSDINGIPKVFSRETYKELDLQFTDSMIDLELHEKAKKLSIPIVEVPIYKNIRHGGRSTSNLKTIFRLIKEVARYWLKTRLFSSLD
ncbi:glycosyltransferase [Candidatus Roizmanbacteria bacterium]|nr:glycosyltransferase [Candidatus Roizmanbacteria bacterium]